MTLAVRVADDVAERLAVPELERVSLCVVVGVVVTDAVAVSLGVDERLGLRLWLGERVGVGD